MNIKYECLKNTDIKEIYDTFIDAFSDYQIKLDVSFEKFSNMMKRRSVDFSVSMGVFEENRLVGFVLNGKRLINDKLTAYDSGTGMRQGYQGLKLGKKMLLENMELLKKNHFDKYILEVITNNEKAFKLYKNFGFIISRKFNCFKNSIIEIYDPKIENDITVVKVDRGTIDRAELIDFFDFKPSWQNSVASVKEDLNRFSMFQAVFEKQVVGYGIIEPKTGDIPILAVNKKFRRISVGSAILKRLKEEASSSCLSILNIPSDYDCISLFLEKHNFKNFAQQYEMEYLF